MVYRLAPGISFAETSGRLIFLDVIADRYTMLAPEAEAALRSMMEPGNRSVPSNGWPERLADLGIIAVEGSGATIAPYEGLPAERSALDADMPNASVGAIASAYFHYSMARAGLRRRGLAHQLMRLERVRASSADRPSPTAKVDAEAAAFAALRRWATPLDQCLPLSLALARRCVAHDPDVKLVLGVKLRPFRAHAWVQRGGTVLNDHVDAVRPFSPVLVA